MRGLPGHRLSIMVVTGFASVDDRRDHAAYYRRVLELVTAGPDRDEVAVNAGTVVNRDPVLDTS